MKEETLEQLIWSIPEPPPPSLGHALRQVGEQCQLCAVTPALLAQEEGHGTAPAPASASPDVSLPAQPLLSAISDHPARSPPRACTSPR